MCANTPFPNNVFDIGFISRFSALMAFDLEDIGFFSLEIFDLDPDKSRCRFDFMQAALLRGVEVELYEGHSYNC